MNEYLERKLNTIEIRFYVDFDFERKIEKEHNL